MKRTIHADVLHLPIACGTKMKSRLSLAPSMLPKDPAKALADIAAVLGVSPADVPSIQRAFTAVLEAAAAAAPAQPMAPPAAVAAMKKHISKVRAKTLAMRAKGGGR